MKKSGRVEWFFSLLASNLVGCVLRVAASLLRTYCLRLTRSTEDKGELCKQLFQYPKHPSVPPFSFSSVFRRRPQRERQPVVSASLLRTFSHHVHKLCASAFLWSNTLALGSCLIASKDKAITKATTSGSVITEPTTQASASSASLRPLLRTYCFRLTRSTEDKGELCQQSFQNPSTPPCLRSLYSPCFAEGLSGSDNQSSLRPLFRTSS